MISESDVSTNAKAWVLLSLALEPLAPASHLRERLVASVARCDRYRPFFRDLAACFDMTERGVRELFARVDRPDAWAPGVGRTVGFMHFQPGPRLASSHCGLVRMGDGARVPRHRHREREVTFVLEGTVVDGDGTRYGPGQILDMAPGSTHALTVRGEPEALLAVLQSEIDVVAP
jgi:quercetin dioxygenase-like cupin family protein